MFDFLKKKIREITGRAEPEPQPKPEPIHEPPPEPIQKPIPAEIQPPDKPVEEKAVEEPEEVPETEPLPPQPVPRPEPPRPIPLEKPKPPKPKPPQPTAPAPEKRKSITERVTDKLKRKDLDQTLWELELALLEGDVAKPVAEQICEKVRESGGRNIEGVLKETLRDILSVPGFDIVQKARESEKPFKIMFLGPNGAGKTLTLAKIASLFQKNNLSSIFSASDTFRAASIEQLEEHAKRLGIKVVKHSYGADPAAVAFDTVKSAEAKGIDCVLIDTAGRQETNKNLIEELKKINRVTKPDIRIYVDEALSGNVLPERALKFKEAVGIDGVILTKMDTDVKGGGAISIAYMIHAPILFLGTGQEYDNLEPFKAEEVLEKIFG